MFSHNGTGEIVMADAKPNMIETIKKIVGTSRQMLHEIGREPTPEELAEKLGMPLERVRKVLKITKEPILLKTPDEEDFPRS
jgi:RNA polymerase primary sigma factor